MGAVLGAPRVGVATPALDTALELPPLVTGREAIAAQLRGSDAQCTLTVYGSPSDSLDLTVIPVWSVPSHWSTYVVAMVKQHEVSTPIFNRTTQKFDSVPANATILNNVTGNFELYTFEKFWTSHPDYDADNDTIPLYSAVALVINGTPDVSQGNLRQYTWAMVGVARIPNTTQVRLQSIHISEPNA